MRDIARTVKKLVQYAYSMMLADHTIFAHVNLMHEAKEVRHATLLTPAQAHTSVFTSLPADGSKVNFVSIPEAVCDRDSHKEAWHVY